MQISIMDLCVSAEVEYTPEQHLLLPTTVTDEMRTTLTAACPTGTKTGRKLKSILERIDLHFANSPFLVHRQTTPQWKEENKQRLDAIIEFAATYGLKFAPDLKELLSSDSFNAAWRSEMTKAAAAKDKSKKRPTKNHQTLWAKVEKQVQKYLAKAYHDVDGARDRELLRRYLRTLWQPQDEASALLGILEHHLDDISAVGEINRLTTFSDYSPNRAKQARSLM